MFKKLTLPGRIFISDTDLFCAFAVGKLRSFDTDAHYFCSCGQLVRTNDESLKQKDNDAVANGLGDYAIGLVVATCFFAFGSVVAKLIAMLGLDIHPYAWMIIGVAVAKVTNIIPEKYENCASVWYKFVSTNWTGALMLGIGIAYTDMGQIIEALTPTYIVCVLVVVLGAIIGTDLLRITLQTAYSESTI